MAITINGVVCQEIRDGFGEAVTDRGPRATKKFLCDWADRYAVANGILGFVSGSGPGGPVTITAPMGYPESLNMLAREIEIKGAGKYTDGSLQGQFTQAIVTAYFGVPSWGAIPQPNMSIDPAQPFTYARQSLSFGSETVTVENSAVKLANGHSLPGVPYGFRMPHVIMHLELLRVPYLPAAEIIAAAEAPLNSVTFLGVDPGYLQFQGADSAMEASTDGTYTQTLSLSFAYRPLLRWDEVFDPDGVSGPQQVRYNGAAILQRSDLSTLIPSAYGGNGP